MDKDGNLSVKERKFTMAYLKTGEPPTAYVMAGYKADPDKASYNLLKKPHIQRYIQTIQNKMEEKELLNLHFIDKKLSLVIERSIPENPDEQMYDVKNGLEAIKIAADIKGYNAPTKTVNSNLNIAADVDMEMMREHLQTLLPPYEKEY